MSYKLASTDVLFKILREHEECILASQRLLAQLGIPIKPGSESWEKLVEQYQQIAAELKTRGVLK